MNILLCNGLAPLIVAVLIFVWLYDTHKKESFLVGYGIILLTWLAEVSLVYGSCLECKASGGAMIDSLCCEWTAIGLLMYSAMTLIIMVIFSIFAFATHRSEKGKLQ